MKPRDFDYRNETAYVVGGGQPYPTAVNAADGSPVYQPQIFPQSQLNNNMSGTDANAIYQATHDPTYAADYNQPYMQDYLATLASMGLTPYRGQQNEADNPSFVTGQGAFMMPSAFGTEQVLPQGIGSYGDGGLGVQNHPNDTAQYYADILNALANNQKAYEASRQNFPAIQQEMKERRMGVL